MNVLDDALLAQFAIANAGPQPVATIPFWYDDALSWDLVYLGGDGLPGSINRIEGARSARKLDIKQAPGRSGSTIQDQGYTPAKFSIVCVITAAEELAGWEHLVAKLRPKPNETPKALDVIHPQLALLNITSCYIETVYQLEPKDKGIYEGKIDCVEFLPMAKKASGKVKQTKPLRLSDTLPPPASKEASKGTDAMKYAPAISISFPTL